MPTQIEIGGVPVEVVRKDIKNVHLSVHPPTGRVRIAAPARMGLETIRVFAVTKLPWIRRHQRKLAEQVREPAREYLHLESHYVWGRRRLLRVAHRTGRPSVALSARFITLYVPPHASAKLKAEVLHQWHKTLLHDAIPALIRRWEPRLGVRVKGYFLQRMKTKWGSCNHLAGHIRLNTELVKKPKDALEYVIVHEMVHLVVPDHSARFIDFLDTHWPGWRSTQRELNELPLGV